MPSALRRRAVIVERDTLDLCDSSPEGHNHQILRPRPLHFHLGASLGHGREKGRVVLLPVIPPGTQGCLETEERLGPPCGARLIRDRIVQGDEEHKGHRHAATVLHARELRPAGHPMELALRLEVEERQVALAKEAYRQSISALPGAGR